MLNLAVDVYNTRKYLFDVCHFDVNTDSIFIMCVCDNFDGLEDSLGLVVFLIY